ncbi:hypothetical protein Mnod_5385 [Methylobacterium nodulans ORS 2060]|uniref:Uncharacterized protein n=1 Tax=Methylobacterium nodulans (strain LMG 21967 / CNCM I-2342 / ORS 2060) TaxID=460265 RepID=B8IMN7_METNO|nr:hypothetical protein Mnod_5385 [Methylobacterium nodulans ORS 2060]
MAGPPHHVEAVQARHDVVEDDETGHGGIRRLVDRQGFPRKSGFVRLELRGGEEPQVGRNAVAGLQEHHVARHQPGSVEPGGLRGAVG